MYAQRKIYKIMRRDDNEESRERNKESRSGGLTGLVGNEVSKRESSRFKYKTLWPGTTTAFETLRRENWQSRVPNRLLLLHIIDAVSKNRVKAD